MGLRLTINAFKGIDRARFRAAFEEVVVRHGGRVSWDSSDPAAGDEVRMAHRDDVHTIYLAYPLDYLIPRSMARRLGSPWYELRIQEGSHWDATLRLGDREVDDFSTLPQYWDDDPAEIGRKKGNAAAVARTWGVPVERIERYLANWEIIEPENAWVRIRRHLAKWGLPLRNPERTHRQGKAYPTDRYEYGNYCQMEDYLFALGGRMPMGKLRDNPSDPYYDGECHRFQPPSEATLKNE